MYVDPLCIYREYVQNAADAIDEARDARLFGSQKIPRINVKLDLSARRIIIRDNGIGIAANVFSRRLTALGASKKRGSKARGFRGVGRLAGLAYSQQLIFRSKAKGAPITREIQWDCRKLKTLLRDHSFKGDLHDVMREVVAFEDSPGNSGEHFFEVELRGVNRIRNDVLLNESVVRDYLSQIAPLPFAKDFSFGDMITEKLSAYGIGDTHNVFLNESDVPLTRPFNNLFQARKQQTDRFDGVEFLEVPGLSGDLDAVGWILHHGYHGALPDRSPIRGLRLRSGNMQIGNANLFDVVFPEPRFNGWAVGEVHLISNKLVPNGRRDDLEQSTHQQNLITHVMPYAKKVAKLARQKSIERNQIARPNGAETQPAFRLAALLTRRQKAWLRKQPKAAAAAYERLLSLLSSHSRPRDITPLIKQVLDDLCK
jgi:molecular chaperone HtpG